MNDRCIRKIDVEDGRITGLTLEFTGEAAVYLSKATQGRKLRCKFCKDEILPEGSETTHYVFSQYKLSTRTFILVVCCAKCAEPLREAHSQVICGARADRAHGGKGDARPVAPEARSDGPAPAEHGTAG